MSLRPFILIYTLTAGSVLAGVVINEIHYHPVEEPEFDAEYLPELDLSEDVHEFIELYNDGDSAVSLAGWEFTKGVKFTFPSGTTIGSSEFLVVAKDPARLQSIRQYTALNSGNTLGPWTGKLKNSGERIVLENASGVIIDEVSYEGRFPWPITANALGETRRWEGLDLLSLQYRGSSLERISSTHSGNTPENWVASIPSNGPTPGEINFQLADTPDPVVTFIDLTQTSSGEKIIRPDEEATVNCAFSNNVNISTAFVDYFIDDVNLTNETISSQPMALQVHGERTLYTAQIPPHPAGSIVRYRIRALPTSEGVTIAPRVGDPYSWYAFSPWSGEADGSRYEIHVSTQTINTLESNKSHNPIYLDDGENYGASRSEGWNGTGPGILVRDGEVWDIHLRYQGSPYFDFSKFRDRSIESLKIKFPRDHRMDGQRSILITDKSDETLDAHRLFQHLDLPISTARKITVSLNGASEKNMVEIGGMSEFMLEGFHERNEKRNGIAIPNDPGWLVKASGLINDSGPWGNADGVPLPSHAGYQPLERYPWTYPTKNQDWRGHAPFHQMLVDHPGAFATAMELRTFFEEQWDVSKALDYYAIAEWAGFWDDAFHNYFYYRQPSGKWNILPWDFDAVFTDRNISSHVFEFTIKTAFASEYEERLYQLNNTVLTQQSLTSNGITFKASGFAATRQNDINAELGLGFYNRPTTPQLISPATSAGHHPGLPFTLGDYFHSSSSAHASTLWEFRHAESDYLDPIFAVNSATSLTDLTLPEDTLRIGEDYFWRVTFIDVDGHRSAISTERPFTAGASALFPGAIQLSEIVSHNSSTTEHDGQFPDWVEIENTVPAELPIGGMSLLSDPSGPIFTFPDDLSLGPNEKIIVWLSTPLIGGSGFYSGFPLSRGGDSLILRNADGSESDSVSFGPQPDGTSLARDSYQEWQLSQPTPLEDNIQLPLGSPSSLRISEWLASPNQGDDWLELYNLGTLPVSLAEITLEDRSGLKTKFSLYSYLGTGAYYQCIADGEIGKGPEHLAFKLDSERDGIFLRDLAGELIDSVFFWNQEKGISEGRLSDFTSIARFSPPSPGARNFESDRDTDGIPDFWESTTGLNPDLSSDAAADPDGDGFTSLEEYAADTLPLDGSDFLSLNLQYDQPVTILSFTRKLGRSYVIESLESDDTWTELQSLSPSSSEAPYDYPVQTAQSGIYRVRVSLAN